jgi:ligand-binding sensor domain-containing protein
MICAAMPLTALSQANISRQDVPISIEDPIGRGLENIGLPMLHNFNAKQYQAHPNNFDVVQDSNGWMYFANLWGVVEFNGTSWRVITLPNGVSCTSLAINADGTIYAGGRNEIGFLQTDSIGRKYYVSLVDQLAEGDRQFNEIWRTYVTPAGTFFASYEALFLKKKGENKITVLKRNLWKVFQVKNDIFIADPAGLYRYKNSGMVPVANAERVFGKFVNLMCSYGDQLLISTSEDGMFIYDGTSLKPWDAPVNKILTQYNPVKVINIRDEHLVFATELNGIYVTDFAG